MKAAQDRLVRHLAIAVALGIDVELSRKLAAIDIGARRATFVLPEGEKQEMPYDFIHVVPPMRAPDAVKNSELA